MLQFRPILPVRQGPELPHVPSSRAGIRCRTGNVLDERTSKAGRKSKQEYAERMRQRYARATKREKGRRRGTTEPGTLLQGQVPIKTFADRAGTPPGVLKIDPSTALRAGSGGARWGQRGRGVSADAEHR
jgi:hypothetical protein